jgi:hypothetical protein
MNLVHTIIAGRKGCGKDKEVNNIIIGLKGNGMITHLLYHICKNCRYFSENENKCIKYSPQMIVGTFETDTCNEWKERKIKR